MKALQRHLNSLKKDIYNQPADDGHSDWAKDVIDKMCPSDIQTVLDVGCATGFCKTFFESKGLSWTGQDYFIDGSDFNFLDQKDGSYDLIFARHVLEHSPMPLIALMDWHRVSRKYALVVLPAPDYWTVYGKNHYYVLPKDNWWNLFDVAGWKIVTEQDFTTSDELFMRHYMPEQKKRHKVKWHGVPKVVEFRYLLEKK